MTGSLQIKCGTYYAVVRLPDVSGKERQKWISTGIKVTGNNKRKANEELRKILTKLDEQKISYSSDTLFVDWINKWMEQKQNEVRLNTLECYRMNIDKHIFPFFMPLKLTLQGISPQHIQDYYNQKIKEGQSANSIQKHSVIIRGALRDALKKNLIPYNAADRATLPTIKKHVGKAYTAAQANELLKVIDNEPMKPAIILGLFYGLRRSEVLGLRWQDFDFNENTIKIRNTVVKSKTLIEHEQTKSLASKRTLFIIPETSEYFLNLRRHQRENRLFMRNYYNVNDHVCVWDNGRPLTTDYLSRRFGIILDKNGLPRIKFHELRHTAGSLLLNKGLSIKQIQEYLGHEQVSTTLDIYECVKLEPTFCKIFFNTAETPRENFPWRTRSFYPLFSILQMQSGKGLCVF